MKGSGGEGKAQATLSKLARQSMHNLKLTSADWYPSQKEIHALHGEATPDLARLSAAKVATYDAFRIAAFPQARRVA